MAAYLAALLVSFSVAVGSTSPVEIIQRVQQLIQRGNLGEARNQLSQALKAFPGHAGLYDLLGVVEAQEGNYLAAESDFRKAIQLDPRLTGAYLNLGHLYQKNADRDRDAVKEALETYRRLLRFDPRNTEANYQSAVLLQDHGSFKASLLHLDRLPAPAQERAQALAVRLADHVGLGERSQAEGLASLLLTRFDLTEADVVSILPTLEANHAVDLEERLLEGLAGRQLASAGTLYQLGLVLERRGKLDQARETFEKVAGLEPNTTVVLVELARVANQLHDYKGALGYLAHARELEPKNAGIHFLWGMICVEENLAEEAYQALKKAVSLDPNNANYNYALGSVILQRDEPNEAIACMQKYCELKPRDPRGHLGLGAAYYYSHDLEEAKKEFSSVTQYPETAPVAHYFLGRLANQEGDLTTAVRELRMALEASPNYADAYAELGLLYMKQREYTHAEEALRQSLELNPEGYPANLNLMILYQRTKDPRAEAQAKRFKEVEKERAKRARDFMRTIEVRP